MEIHQIKSQLSITQVLHYYQIEVKRKHINCPFHDDKTPSMQVYPSTGSVYCFSGNCSKSGKPIDVIDFIMYKEQLTKHQAINKAKQLLGNFPLQTKALATSFAILQNQTKRSKKAQDYLQSRNLENLQEIGSNHRNGNNTVSYQYPHLKNCIVFPLKNKKNEIASLYGRSILNNKRNNHYYLNNRQGLYPNYPNPSTQHLILTESIIDTATLLLHLDLPKYTSVLACYGTNGYTKEHTEAVSQLKNLQTITIFFDGDDAGQLASKKLQNQLQETVQTKILVQIVKTPTNEDINSLWCNNQSTELFDMLLSNLEITNYQQNQNQPSKTQHSKPNIQNQKPTTNQQNQTPNPNLQKSAKSAGETSQKPTLTIKGNIKNQGDSLKITLQTSYLNKNIIQKLDLYDYNNLEKHAKITAKKLDLDQETILNTWQKLVNQIETNKTDQKLQTKDQRPNLDKTTKKKCTTFLKSPDLLQRINQAIGQTGVVGEENNRLLLFLIAISYQSKQPLHGLIQGSSGSGKTTLLQSIYNLIPTEDKKTFTRVTESSFYNYNENSLQHKLLCFEDIDGLKEEALLALRELQSNGKLISSTSQKLESGRIQSVERLVNGPIASLSCTTKGELYEDNISRSFVVAVDESQAQTKRIIDYQNKLAQGLINTKQVSQTKTFIANCIRLLQNTAVVNPYASKIKLPQNIHKLRRLHRMYQVLVAQITYLHQYQRKKNNKGQLIAQKQDLQYASDILLESILLKIDELDGSLRQFYETLKENLKTKSKDYSFNRFEVKKITKLGKTQIHHYLQQLVHLEYLQQFGYANRGFTYKINYWDDYKTMRSKVKKELQLQIDKL